MSDQDQTDKATEASKGKSKSKAQVTVKRKVNKSALKDKEYRLCNARSGETFLIKVGRNKQLVIFDEATQRNRAIRHCPNEKSIFLDEQTEHAVVETIEFQYGRLVVDKYDIITQEFMRASPENKANGGRKFELVDEEKDSNNMVEREELVNDIKNRIREEEKKGDIGITTLERLVSTLIGSVAIARTMDVAELKRKLYAEANANPSFFTKGSNEITAFDDSFLEVKYVVLSAIADGVLKSQPSIQAITWADGSEIFRAARGKDTINEFSEFLVMEENQLTYKEIIDRL